MEIPKELHGIWYTSNGSTQIHANGITLIDMKEDTTSFTGEMITETSEMTLGEDFQLYQSKDLYVFNLKESEGRYWEIGVLQRHANGDIHYYTCNDPDSYVDDKRLKIVETNYLVGDEEKTFKKLQDDPEMILQHVVFSGKMDHKTVVKLLVQDNLVNIYKADGTIETPNF